MVWQAYRRTASSKACSFCLMLATRGAVYMTESTALAGHDHCNCDAELETDPADKTAIRIDPMDAARIVAQRRGTRTYRYDMSKYRNLGVDPPPQAAAPAKPPLGQIELPFDPQPTTQALPGEASGALRALADRRSSRAVTDYMSSNYHFINHYLRYGEVKPDSPWTAAELDDLIAAIDGAYDAVPTATKADMHVFRGWSASRRLDFEPGTVIEDKGFISTAADLATADTFPGLLVAVRVRKGTKVLNLAGGSETEVLMKRGTKFRVIGKEMVEGYEMTVVEAA